MPKGGPQQLECVDKEQFKIKWLPIIHNVKCTFTQKWVPRQIDKCNLDSVNKVSVQHVKYRAPFLDVCRGHLNFNIHPCIY